ncbi:MAG: hypothetical protein Q9170_001736 [Blastenia crenularia]
MSASAASIPLDQFAEAITELPLGNLHAKAAELRNSIAHLISSNRQLQDYAADGDHDYADAIKENNEVIDRMEMRINLLRREVESRGFQWGEDASVSANGKSGHETDHGQTNHAAEHPGSGTHSNMPSSSRQGGSLGDEELESRLRDQVNGDMVDGEDGIHL